MGYPAKVTVNDETLPKSALQYIENHDHSRFVCNFGRILRDNDLLSEGDRDRWYKVQPYLIALLTAKGIPLLWQGQEFGENYYVPTSGWGRVMLFRPVRWDYFYDPIGKRVIWLVRRLLQIRRQAQFRHGEHYFYNDYGRYQSKGVLLFSRKADQSFSLVALNFTDESSRALRLSLGRQLSGRTARPAQSERSGGRSRTVAHDSEQLRLHLDQPAR